MYLNTQRGCQINSIMSLHALTNTHKNLQSLISLLHPRHLNVFYIASLYQLALGCFNAAGAYATKRIHHAFVWILFTYTNTLIGKLELYKSPYAMHH